MDSKQSEAPYSFSMINLVRLIADWNLADFHRIMESARTRGVELVPSMLLGLDWDQCDDPAMLQGLHDLQARYQVSSIQSLTFGLDLQLIDDIHTRPDWQHRFRRLNRLGSLLSCHRFVLGSPGQKKLRAEFGDPLAHQRRLADNCRVMAELLGPEGILCLEHNTIEQGAEYANTLSAIQEVVAALHAAGCTNVGINLDTKCLLQEFGDDVRVRALLADPGLAATVRTIQVSLDFLSRGCDHAGEDVRSLAGFAAEHGIPISLEEFGLQPEQLGDYIGRWRAATGL